MLLLRFFPTISAKPYGQGHSTHSYLLVNTKKSREKQINKLLIN